MKEGKETAPGAGGSIFAVAVGITQADAGERGKAK